MFQFHFQIYVSIERRTRTNEIENIVVDRKKEQEVIRKANSEFYTCDVGEWRQSMDTQMN